MSEDLIELIIIVFEIFKRISLVVFAVGFVLSILVLSGYFLQWIVDIVFSIFSYEGTLNVPSAIFLVWFWTVIVGVSFDK